LMRRWFDAMANLGLGQGTSFDLGAALLEQGQRAAIIAS
jgi:hypothetical protein